MANESFKFGLLVKFIKSGCTRLRTGKTLTLGPKPVRTHQKARQCGEVKSAQFKDRTSDRRLLV
ncbi:hypothetical protein Hanom_Chr12g01073031 [Helianthus anomalus]